MKKTQNGKWFPVFWRIALLAGITLAIGAAALYMGLYMTYNGPEAARDFLVRTFEETARGPSINRAFLDDKTVKQITASSRMDLESDVNTGLIHIRPKDEQEDPTSGDSGSVIPPEKTSGDLASGELPSDPTSDGYDENGIQLIEIKGGAYKGKLMVVEDPTRVFVGYSNGRGGMEVNDFIEDYDAIGGTNAGGFMDSGGHGDGSVAAGLVIQDGKIKHGSRYDTYSVCGFDKNGILYVGKMTGAKALEKGIVSACSFGPALIMNGVPANKTKSFSSGRNPRTAIGQRADGAVLLLVIEGRQVDSLGATYDELVDILYSYGAVNATNLDGGSSSIMYYKGEKVIRPSTIASVSRGVATAIIVK